MRHLALALPLLVLLAAPANADGPAPAPAPYRGYVGGSLGFLVFAGEVTLDGGVRPLGDVEFLWIHAAVVAGDDSSGDFLRYGYRAALGGIELRSTGDRLRGVVGVDFGAATIETYNEGYLVDTDTVLARSWHGGGELVFGRVVARLGLSGMVRAPTMPLVTLGLAVQL